MSQPELGSSESIRALSSYWAEAYTASLCMGGMPAGKPPADSTGLCSCHQVEAVSKVKRGDGDLEELRREQLDARLARRMKRKVADHTKVGTRVVAMQPVGNKWFVKSVRCGTAA